MEIVPTNNSSNKKPPGDNNTSRQRGNPNELANQYSDKRFIGGPERGEVMLERPKSGQQNGENQQKQQQQMPPPQPLPVVIVGGQQQQQQEQQQQQKDMPKATAGGSGQVNPQDFFTVPLLDPTMTAQDHWRSIELSNNFERITRNFTRINQNAGFGLISSGAPASSSQPANANVVNRPAETVVVNRPPPPRQEVLKTPHIVWLPDDATGNNSRGSSGLEEERVDEPAKQKKQGKPGGDESSSTGVVEDYFGEDLDHTLDETTTTTTTGGGGGDDDVDPKSPSKAKKVPKKQRQRKRKGRAGGGKGMYIVEKILDQRVDESGKKEYQIKWEDYDLEEASWEPAENVAHFHILIAQFEASQADQQGQPELDVPKSARGRRKKSSVQPEVPKAALEVPKPNEPAPVDVPKAALDVPAPPEVPKTPSEVPKVPSEVPAPSEVPMPKRQQQQHRTPKKAVLATTPSAAAAAQVQAVQGSGVLTRSARKRKPAEEEEKQEDAMAKEAAGTNAKEPAGAMAKEKEAAGAIAKEPEKKKKAVPTPKKAVPTPKKAVPSPKKAVPQPQQQFGFQLGVHVPAQVLQHRHAPSGEDELLVRYVNGTHQDEWVPHRAFKFQCPPAAQMIHQFLLDGYLMAKMEQLQQNAGDGQAQ